MKKVFISVPMKGRTKENIEKSIEKMKKVATAYLDEELEFVNTIVQDKPPYETNKEHTAVWYLGKSLEILSQCDIFLGVYDTFPKYKGCYIENKVADTYGIKRVMLEFDYICPDLCAPTIPYTCKS